MTGASPQDRAEQARSATGDEPVAERPALAVEASEADVLEQAAAAGPGEHRTDRDLPLEVDPADAAEQAVVVELDEDEHR